MSASARRLAFLIKQNQPKVLTQEEANISAHRLARTAKFGSTTKYQKTESAEEYAQRFFSENQNAALDKRDPLAKLETVNAMLNDRKTEINDRFSYLSQKKALVLMIYGENTQELFQTYVQIAAFYNDDFRIPSAMRHLKKAQQIMQQIQITNIDHLKFSIEYAYAVINSDVEDQEEYYRHVAQSQKIIANFTDIECDDQIYNYKRSYLLARIYNGNGQCEDAITMYGDAIAEYEMMTNNETTENTARLYHELGATYEAVGDIKNARNYYRTAYDIYSSLEINDKAQELSLWLDEHDSDHHAYIPEEEEEDY
ncbi:hypothetical protein TVAG_192470 [Trichomonas vaginalis G3]|uniref:Uncharacterized protein n=1 Tax=Trichomonas vaginalis (strain ATCC PRA-98 / G3) TaxID=412133 RepID=A2DGW1_TRIV3|nr:TPR-like family [Trichomonas vaginalis G3]EAY20271.1 hypothetical protein TVAG_192470 [Trichomonas vaginalis G3]KAI5529143.1 TPR-like family [Trichomonas vaginalis G3]|eukprot:XP_001581257.1 hypothetical protein [Trichomonas vaginalis G3]